MKSGTKNEEPRTKNTAKPRCIDPGLPASGELVGFLLGFSIVCAISTVVLVCITIEAVQDKVATRKSEQQAWEQVNTLRATVAILRSGQGMEEF